MSVTAAALVLVDGSIFEGEAIGADPPGGITSGEVVFNTVLTGYQEVITDPSYAGQIINFTYPHIGNYGVTDLDNESRRPFCRGVVIRELARRRSNWRSTADLGSMLASKGVAGIAGVDTRRLTRHIRDAGAMPGAFGTADLADLKESARSEPGTDGIDLVATVSCQQPYTVAATGGNRRIVAMDFGIKSTILTHLATLGTVDVVPAATTPESILALEPDGVFLSNGPGDPAAVDHAVGTIRALIDQVPIFGICLGHQLLSLAIGAETVKMPFGHHGGNHPVMNLATGVIEITSQNHNFAVAADSLDGRADITHVNLNDGVCEGMSLVDAPAFSVQHHPEASPGPHDSSYLFPDFEKLMSRVKGSV
ncbi:MAG: glutamine-hydrolyzing carbamoyl-phosphate synthase small subunit [Acidimicrobiales bacterium]